MLDSSFRGMLPRGVGLGVDELTIGRVALLFELPNTLCLRVVDDHPGRDAVALEY